MSKLISFRHQWKISGYANLPDKIHDDHHPFINSTVTCNKEQYHFIVSLYPKGYNQQCRDYVSIKFDNQQLQEVAFVDCTIAIVDEHGEKVRKEAFEIWDKETILREFITNQDLLNSVNGLLLNGDFTLYLEGFAKSKDIANVLFINPINKSKLTTDIFDANSFPKTKSFALKWSIENVQDFSEESQEIEFLQTNRNGFSFYPKLQNSENNFTFVTKLKSNYAGPTAIAYRFSIVDENDGKLFNYFRREIIVQPEKEYLLDYQIDRESFENGLTVTLEIIQIVDLEIEIVDLNEADLSNYLRLISSSELVDNTNVSEWIVDVPKNENSQSEEQNFLNEQVSALNTAQDELCSFKEKYLKLDENPQINNDSIEIDIQENPELLLDLEQIVNTKMDSALAQTEIKIAEISNKNEQVRSEIGEMQQEVNDIKKECAEMQNEQTVKQSQLISLTEKIEWLIWKIGEFVQSAIKSFHAHFESGSKTSEAGTSQERKLLKASLESECSSLNEATYELQPIKQIINNHFVNMTNATNVIMNNNSNVTTGNVNLQSGFNHKELISQITKIVEDKVEVPLKKMNEAINELGAKIDSNKELNEETRKKLQEKEQEIQFLKSQLNDATNSSEVLDIVEKIELLISSLYKFVKAFIFQNYFEFDFKLQTNDDTSVLETIGIDSQVTENLTSDSSENCENFQEKKFNLSETHTSVESFISFTNFAKTSPKADHIEIDLSNMPSILKLPIIPPLLRRLNEIYDQTDSKLSIKPKSTPNILENKSSESVQLEPQVEPELEIASPNLSPVEISEQTQIETQELIEPEYEPLESVISIERETEIETEFSNETQTNDTSKTNNDETERQTQEMTEQLNQRTISILRTNSLNSNSDSQLQRRRNLWQKTKSVIFCSFIKPKDN